MSPSGMSIFTLSMSSNVHNGGITVLAINVKPSVDIGVDVLSGRFDVVTAFRAAFVAVCARVVDLVALVALVDLLRVTGNLLRKRLPLRFVAHCAGLLRSREEL